MSEAGQGSRTRILLVEDNEDDYVLVETFLPAQDFSIIWCSSARMARERLRQESFELILLDHGLPDSNSLSFLEEIGKDYPGVPVIILTGRNDQALAISAKKMGASTYLLKDEITVHLLAVVQDVLNKRHEEGDASPGPDSHVVGKKFEDTAERIYKVLLETMNEGCLAVDAEGVITFANRAIDCLLSPGAERLPGRRILDLFSADTAPDVNASLRVVLTAREPRSATLDEACIAREHARARDGLPAVRISMRSLHAKDGQCEGAVVVLTDISEMLRVQKKLSELFQNEKAQHNQLRAIIESSRDGILLVDRDLCVRVANGPAMALLRLPGSTKDWTNRSLLDVMNELKRHGSHLVQMALAEIRRLQGGDESANNGEMDLVSHIVYWMNLPVQGDSSRLLVLQDVTAERSLQRMREDLIRTTVHDLRNPLGVISESLQYLDSLDLAKDEAEAREVIDIALGGAQKMLLLVNQILDVSRLESGKMPIHQRASSLDELVRDAVHAQSSLATARGVHLKHIPGSAELVAWVDPSMIDRVLQNLLDNAIKFTFRGGSVEIRAGLWEGEVARAEAEDEIPVPHYYISVADYGPGIPVELRDRLFEKFVSGSHEGSGLGLAFCKLAVEAHGGSIWYENTPNLGATFFFTVPAVVS